MGKRDEKDWLVGSKMVWFNGSCDRLGYLWCFGSCGTVRSWQVTVAVLAGNMLAPKKVGGTPAFAGKFNWITFEEKRH